MVHVLKGDMPEYERLGVEQFFTQTAFVNYSYALNYYVASKLAWDASLSTDELITDFCNKSYGAAGPAMEKYHRFIEDSWENNPHHVAYSTNPIQFSILELFPSGLVEKADELLRKAETVETGSQSKKRVKAIRTDFEYLRLVINYLNAILEPFEEVDLEDSAQVIIASKKSEAIGNELAPTVINYLIKKVQKKTSRQFRLPGGGIVSVFETHKHSDQIINIIKRRKLK
jgi:hypothetical protein